MKPHHAVAGVVLVLLSGLVVLLLFLAVLFLRFTRATAGGGRSAREAALSRLAAGSGLEYGGARLFAEDGFPRRSRTPADRGESWLSRDGASVPFDRMKNPSYAHGEPWIDDVSFTGNVTDDDADGWADENGEGGRWDGAFDGGEPFVDLDRDGKLSVMTGRVRGGGARGIPFTLRIEAKDGKIPLNVGYLRPDAPNGVNEDGDAQVDEPGEPGSSPDRNANGIPDWREHRALRYMNGIIHALNNLGYARLGDAHPRRWAVPSGDPSNPGETFLLSWLGYDLIVNRPEGGYRSWGEVEKTLLSLGLGYAKGDVEGLKPFIDLGPYIVPPTLSRGQVSRPGYDTLSCWDVPCSLVSFPGAPPEVLRSIWTYLAMRMAVSSTSGPGDPAAWALPYPRTGPAGLPTTKRFSESVVLLFPDETAKLSEWCGTFREGGIYAWETLYRELLAASPVVFSIDLSFLPGYPLNQRIWAEGKADMAYQAVALDPYPYGTAFANPAHTSAVWGSPMGWGAQALVAKAGLEGFFRVRHPVDYDPANPAGFSPVWDWPGPFRPFTMPATSQALEDLLPQGLTMAAPCLFSIESRAGGQGGGSRFEGELRVRERLDLASQEDFENWEKGRGYARIGMRVVDAPAPAARHNQKRDHLNLMHPCITTLPGPNQWSTGFHNATRWADPYPEDYYAYYSRAAGAIGLGQRKSGPWGSMIYWRLSEDFDMKPNTWQVSGKWWAPGAGAQPYPYPAPGAPYPDPAELWPVQSGFPADPAWAWATAPVRLPHGRLLPSDFSPTGFGGGSPYEASPTVGIAAIGARAWDIVCQCPGMVRKDPTQPLAKQDLIWQSGGDAWIAPNATICIMDTGSTITGGDRKNAFGVNRGYTIYLNAARGRMADGREGTIFRFAVRWLGKQLEPAVTTFVVDQGRQFFIADDGAADLPDRWGHHIAWSIQRSDTPVAPGVDHVTTSCKLYVDGRPDADRVGSATPATLPPWAQPPGDAPSYTWSWSGAGGAMEIAIDAGLVQRSNLPTPPVMDDPYTTNREAIWIEGVGELRLYGMDVDPSKAEDIFEEGRFLRKGTYTSPLYVFDDWAALDKVQWTGIVPRRWKDVSGNPADPIRVDLHLFANDSGAGPPLVRNLWPAGSGRIYDLPKDLAVSGESVRSFRYVVTIDATSVTDPPVLADTPLFESIWLSYRQRRRSAGWLSASAR